MFTNLLFLILVLLVVNLAPEAAASGILPSEALLQGILLFTFLCFAIALQNRLFIRNRPSVIPYLQALTNVQILGFFVVYHFLLAAHRSYFDPTSPTSSYTLLALISLSLYFTGLFVFHYTSFTSSVSSLVPISRFLYASTQVRFLFPFSIPFLGFHLLFDIADWLPEYAIPNKWLPEENSFGESVLFASLMVLFLAIMMIFLPAIIQAVWGCHPLKDTSLRDRLNALCVRARFRHAGIKVWTVMNHSLTAAIIGVVPRFRYVMFSAGLLQQLPPEQIEAILAHEIGHSYHKHLLYYPFVIAGMIISTGLFWLFFDDPIFEFLALQDLLHDSSMRSALIPVVLFIPFALIAIVYFRFVFGFFSRNFERQADLHLFRVGVPAEHLIDALHAVGVATGGTHKTPNWHHYSIQQRIDFLRACLANPDRVNQHHKRVRRIFIGYLALLVAALFLLVSPYAINVKESLREAFNSNTRTQLASQFAEKYDLEGDPTTIQNALEISLRDYTVIHVPGVVEFYAAQILYQRHETTASLQLMEAAWRRFDFSEADPTAVVDFEVITRKIIEDALENREMYDEIEAVIRAMTEAKETQREFNAK